MPWCSPCRRRLLSDSTAWPERRSFSISSNTRAGGRFSIRGASFGIGAAVLALDGEPELRREPHRAQHAHRILAVARDRIADQAQAARLHVGHPSDVVPDALGGGVEVERVHGEVAADRVFGLRAEHVVGEKPAVLVGGIVAGLPPAKGRNFDGLRPGENMHEAKAPPDDERAAEERLHLFRRRVGGEVEVLGRDAEQQVAHGTADDECLEPGLLQLAHDVERGARELAAANRVLLGAVDARFAARFAGNQARKQAAYHDGSVYFT